MFWNASLIASKSVMMLLLVMLALLSSEITNSSRSSSANVAVLFIALTFMVGLVAFPLPLSSSSPPSPSPPPGPGPEEDKDTGIGHCISLYCALVVVVNAIILIIAANRRAVERVNMKAD